MLRFGSTRNFVFIAVGHNKLDASIFFFAVLIELQAMRINMCAATIFWSTGLNRVRLNTCILAYRAGVPILVLAIHGCVQNAV